jgi:hypothetical protein
MYIALQNLCVYIFSDFLVFPYLLKTPQFNHVNCSGSIPPKSSVVFSPSVFLNFCAKIYTPYI